MHLDEYAAPGVEGAVVTRLTGRPLRRADLSLSWQTACAGAGLKGVRVHDLRHHAATLIARNREVTLKELMATIGHSSPVAALRYQHATQERSKAIANYVDSVISRERETPQVAVVRFRS
jgi:integrase